MKIKFKKGSKIHIKDSQKGSFTKYCNGKVTEECIQKGKNSPDPKIRKKATFAANARKWNHKDGGEIQKHQGFVDGVNVLDSNPSIYKKIKQREKIKKAQEGTKFSEWLNNNKDTISKGLEFGGDIFNTLKTSSKKNNLIEDAKRKSEAEYKAREAEARSFLYQKALGEQKDPSAAVNQFNAFNDANKNLQVYLNKWNSQRQNELMELDQAQAQNTSDAITGVVGSVFNLGKTLFNKKSQSNQVTNNITPSTNTTTSSSPFKVDISKTLVTQANNLTPTGGLAWQQNRLGLG